jgi:hypothetical protein
MFILGGGGGKGYFMPWNKKRRHQKLIYSVKYNNTIALNILFKRNFLVKIIF